MIKSEILITMGMGWPVSSDKWKAPLVTYLIAQLPLGGSFAIHYEPRSPHALRVLDHGYVLITSAEREVKKLQFFDKIGQAKSVGFRFYSAI